MSGFGARTKHNNRHCYGFARAPLHCQGGQRSRPEYEEQCEYTADFVDKLSALPECRPAEQQMQVTHGQRLRSVSAVASSKRQPKDPRRYGSMDDMRTHLQQQTTGSGGLAGLLNWLSNSAFGATKCPEILTMNPSEVTQRLMLLKGVFPSCNVARMVELLPEGFLLQSQQNMVRRVAAINIALRDGLPGANIDLMVQEDPTILFEDKHSVSSGLRELHDLWDIDQTALSNSNPWELALAIRTMSDKDFSDCT